MSQTVVDSRRALHQIPELDNQLPETLAYVRSVLEPLGCVLSTPISGSICAFFDAGKAEAVAFRADMDALPVTEVTGLPYASAHSGIMHACGHDGHTAMALALAEYVSVHLSELPRNVLFLFQPAEETTGGAKGLCDSGILETHHVTRVFGLHLWPGLEAGQVFTRPGPLMARANEVTVTVTGKSVHLSRASQGLDAMTAGTEYLRRAYAMVDALPPEEPRAFLFGKMVSGTVRNAVSGKTVLEGSLRTYREETYHFCKEQLEAIGREITVETGCGVEVYLNEGYPAVWNHEGLYENICAQLYQDAPALLETPALAAEDFSFYQRAVPGVFFFLGVGNTPELHAPDFCFDDELVLPQGVEFLKKLLMLA
ncbi:M20 metallopeptidase family protein [Dysosmobacter sp.]|uniref:M20 metallopeptidase family protein n=1 Tax=Dysosmobacter sp. TaxID=2591382 RepID=UPI002A9420BE|nr:amidohydrolase [Dysosmobacter sp.]MDY5611882.1 amidohydrolase [Dysosmobacter sp.]